MRLLRCLYALTIFLSAFLLFVVEPMVAKQLLPILGGSSSVWTTCLVFFETVLLLGYLYAHWLTTRLARARQADVHILLLTAALLALGVHWQPGTAGVSYHPAWTVIWTLTAVIGLPFFALSTTTPLMNAWYARSLSISMPYRLFALSNLASLLALACYPVLIEPHLTMRQQTSLWTPAFFLFAVLSGAIAWQGRRAYSAEVQANPPVLESGSASPPQGAERPGAPALWFLLAMGGAMMLVAVTTHLSQNIAAIPLLWLPPLALYLLTFILAFQGTHWYPRPTVLRLALVAMASIAYVLWDIRIQVSISLSVPLFLGALFLICFFLHGELYARRPEEARLTQFYLFTAAGGAAGTILVGVVAPMVLRANYDLACTLVFLGLICLAATWKEGWGPRAIWAAATVAAILVVNAQVRQYNDDTVALMRSFYGALRVKQSHVPPYSDTDRQLFHGTIEHGAEWFAPAFRDQPLTYYGVDSGVGMALRLCCGQNPKRVGVVGLGTGTLAAYGHAGDLIRFYEIDPLVERLARHWFTFLRDTPAATDIVLGDARVSLAHEPAQHFNVIVVDAFSGDAIPTHLLTRQALALYQRHLKLDGIIAFHVSNQFIDLEPVIAAIAKDAGLTAIAIHSHADEDNGLYYADWVLVTASAAFLRQPDVANNALSVPLRPDVRMWTDSYSSIFPLLKWQGH